MRVRITKTLAGSIDGIQLARLSRGQVYDVYTSLACYLLSEGMAEPAQDDEPVAVLPVENQMFGAPAPAEPRKNLIFPRSIAVDAPRKNNRPSRSRKKH